LFCKYCTTFYEIAPQRPKRRRLDFFFRLIPNAAVFPQHGLKNCIFFNAEVYIISFLIIFTAHELHNKNIALMQSTRYIHALEHALLLSGIFVDTVLSVFRWLFVEFFYIRFPNIHIIVLSFRSPLFKYSSCRVVISGKNVLLWILLLKKIKQKQKYSISYFASNPLTISPHPHILNPCAGYLIRNNTYLMYTTTCIVYRT
jgi:hypothetical protein